ncbi:DUF2809 domain-containing protein [Flavobacterium sp. SUN052]|uniref:ribosomal maturation YjgA family protein n=1 Tax=Flavobacterium sp. SUN052 TaxID=3002441 RepID=UPI00237E8881|nr:DUF2809 domain-containing protein [Flavobacterium sp. SUN052]MEC4004810.1 DUF2809 domain-containing protein [Flavobacterium sp. SUN052]
MKSIKTKYLIISCCILFIEITIAVFVNDQFIRPIFGDYLASILVFYLLATFLKNDLNKIAIISLLISYTIEFSQYFHILELFHLDKIKILKIILGNSFSWTDMLAYTLGIITVVLIHNYKK